MARCGDTGEVDQNEKRGTKTNHNLQRQGPNFYVSTLDPNIQIQLYITFTDYQILYSNKTVR